MKGPSRTPSPISRLWGARVWLVLGPVRFYQRFLGPMLPNTCRFSPSCSTYMIDAVLCYGVIKGIWAGTWRILRCNPFGGQGFDPVQDFAWYWEADKRQQVRKLRREGEKSEPLEGLSAVHAGGEDEECTSQNDNESSKA